MSSDESPRLPNVWLRRSIYALIGVCIGSLLGCHYLPGSYLRYGMQSSVKRAELFMPDPERCDLSLLSGAGAIQTLHIFRSEDSQDPLVQIQTLELSIAPLDTFFADKHRIYHCAIDDCTINLRNPDSEEDWATQITTLLNRSQQTERRSSRSTLDALQAHQVSILWPQESELDIAELSLQLADSTCDITFRSTGSCHGLIKIQQGDTLQVTGDIKQLHATGLHSLHISASIDEVLQRFGPHGHFDISFTYVADAQQRTLRIDVKTTDGYLVPLTQNDIWMNSIKNLATLIKRVRGVNPKHEIHWQFTMQQETGKAAVKDYGIGKLMTNLVNALAVEDHNSSSRP